MKKYFFTAFIAILFLTSQVVAQTTPEQQAQIDRCAKLPAMSAEWYAAYCNRPGYVPDSPGATAGPTTTQPPTKEQTCASLTPLSAEWMTAGCNTGATPVNDPVNIFGTVGSGAQSTGAINGAPAADANTIIDTPQSSSSQLNQCSSIKFISLLDILMWVKCIIVVAIIPLIYALAFMFFLWGVMKFINANDSPKREEGKKFIIAGLIGLFVMTSLWGIVTIVGKTLGTGSAVPLLQTAPAKTTP